MTGVAVIKERKEPTKTRNTNQWYLGLKTPSQFLIESFFRSE